MKTSTALVFLALVAGCLAEMSPEEEAKKCMEDLGVTEEDLKNDEGKRKCFMQCILESSGVMNSEGKPDHDKAEEVVGDHISDEDKRRQVMDAFDQCADKTNESEETDPCERGAAMFTCLMEHEEIKGMLQPSEDK